MGVFNRRIAFSLIGAVLLLGACAEVQLAIHGVKRAQDAVDPKAGSQTQTAALTRRRHSQDRARFTRWASRTKSRGVWYYPREEPDYDATGIASWYGADFHGKATANGEIYDMNSLTAAHKTLPMPSSVRITNLENGRSMVLRVNDRGPFVHGRIIDVSRRAAQLLGFHKSGTAKVRVAVLQAGGKRFIAAKPTTTEEDKTLVAAVPRDGVSSASLPPPSGVEAAPAPVATSSTPQVAQKTARATSMYVQAGAFSIRENANRLRDDLAHLGPTIVSKVTIKGQTFHRVRLGPWTPWRAPIPRLPGCWRAVTRARASSLTVTVERCRVTGCEGSHRAGWSTKPPILSPPFRCNSIRSNRLLRAV